MKDKLAFLSQQLSPVFKHNEVIFAGLFGSQVKGSARSNSDYDFLVEFKPKKKYTLLNLAALKEDLEKVLHTPVDVVTAKGLDRYIKQEVLDSTMAFYDYR